MSKWEPVGTQGPRECLPSSRGIHCYAETPPLRCWTYAPLQASTKLAQDVSRLLVAAVEEGLLEGEVESNVELQTSRWETVQKFSSRFRRA